MDVADDDLAGVDLDEVGDSGGLPHDLGLPHAVRLGLGSVALQRAVVHSQRSSHGVQAVLARQQDRCRPQLIGHRLAGLPRLPPALDACADRRHVGSLCVVIGSSSHRSPSSASTLEARA